MAIRNVAKLLLGRKRIPIGIFSCGQSDQNIAFHGRFTFEWICNTKEQIYFNKRAENHKAEEQMFKSSK